VIAPVRDDVGRVLALLALRLSPFERLFAPIRSGDSSSGTDILGFDQFGHLIKLNAEGSITQSESDVPLPLLGGAAKISMGMSLSMALKKSVSGAGMPKWALAI
jgi:hypothetical protein